MSYACGNLYSVMIVLHIDYDAAVYEIMKHANRVNSVLCIDLFPFKMHVTYLQRVYISSS